MISLYTLIETAEEREVIAHRRTIVQQGERIAELEREISERGRNWQSKYDRERAAHQYVRKERNALRLVLGKALRDLEEERRTTPVK